MGISIVTLCVLLFTKTGICVMTNYAAYRYVLFVRTGSEERLVEKLKEKLDNEKLIPFVLKKTCIRRRRGIKTQFKSLCFPGYVFIESAIEPKDFLNDFWNVISGIDGIYKILNYGDKTDIAIHEDERAVMDVIFGEDYCIDVPKIFKEGDSVVVISGALRGHESKIVRLDKDGVVITFDVFGKAVEVRCGVEFVRAAEAEKNIEQEIKI